MNPWFPVDIPDTLILGNSPQERQKRSLTYWTKQFPQHLPVLALHGGADERIPLEQTHVLHTLSPNTTLQIIPEGNHALSNWSNRDQTICTFFQNTLKKN